MRKLAFAFALLILAIPCQARVITVKADGTGDYRTIQAAIDHCQNGDEIVVGDGTYNWAYISGVIHKNKAMVIRSENGPKNCVINCRGDNGFWFYSTGTTDIRLEGFTFINDAYHFGAIYCSERSSPTITNCIITNNRGSAGIRCNSQCNPTISNCVITNNHFRLTYKSSILLQASSNPKIINCVISDNSNVGIYCEDSNPTISNCTITDNWGGVHCKRRRGACSASINNSIVWTNSPYEILLENGASASITYSDVQDGYEGEGNIDVEPLFGLDGYHLLGASPCIDAGDPNYIAEANETDIDGELRIMGCSVDMGADEFTIINVTPIACVVGGDQIIEVDANCEGRVVLDGSCSSDEDSTEGTNDDIAEFNWYEILDPCDANSDILLGGGEVIECNLPLGEHDIMLEVTDKACAYDINEVTVAVVDVTPPEFSLWVEPNVLWPVNHKMVEIRPSWVLSDNCDEWPDVSLVSITMNEDAETKGSGHTIGDIWVDANDEIQLRAERSGKGTGRVYTITYQAVDDSNNVTVDSAIVTVPHDMK